MKKLKQFFNLVGILIVVMLMNNMPLEVLAAEGDIIDTGSCGETAVYAITEKSDGTYLLDISGSGDMYNEVTFYVENLPWRQYRQNISEIVVENGITSIGAYSFHRMNKVTKVTLPDTLLQIGELAFEDTEALSNIDLPKNLKEIGMGAFSRSALTDVVVPRSVEIIGTAAFLNTPYEEGHTEDFFIINDRFLYLYNGTEEKVTVPDGITSIVGTAFEGNKTIKQVSLPGNLDYIGDNAFFGCENLSELNIPESIKYIGGSAFSYTPFMEKHKESFVIFGEVLYKYNGLNAKVTIPDKVKIISPYAFSGSYIAELTIGKNVREIGRCAFFNCIGMEDVYIPATVEKIGHCAFGYVERTTLYGVINQLFSTVIYAENEACEAARYINRYYSNPTSYIVGKIGGEIGKTAVYDFDYHTGVLTISGTGKLEWPDRNKAPWENYENKIKTVIVESGIEDTAEGLRRLRYVTELYLSEGIKTVGCIYSMNISSLTIPASVTEFDGTVYCYKLREINVAEGNEKYTSIDGLVYDKNVKYLIYIPNGKIFPKVYVFPETLTTIRYSATKNYKGACNGMLVFPLGYEDVFEGLNEATLYFKGMRPYNFNFYRMGKRILCHSDMPYWQGWCDDDYDKVFDVNLYESDNIALSEEAIVLKFKEQKELQIISDCEKDYFGSNYFEWGSSDDYVATCDNGVVIGGHQGKATIIATSFDGRLQLSCEVVVIGDGAEIKKDSDYYLKENSEEEIFVYDGSIGDNYSLFSVEGISGAFLMNVPPKTELWGYTRECMLKWYSPEDGRVYDYLDLGEITAYYVADGILYYSHGFDVLAYDIAKREQVCCFEVSDEIVDESNDCVTAIGADKKGRIIVFTGRRESYYNSEKRGRVYLYSRQGVQISSDITTYSVTDFAGYDDERDCFYVIACNQLKYEDDVTKMLCYGQIKGDQIYYYRDAETLGIYSDQQIKGIDNVSMLSNKFVVMQAYNSYHGKVVGILNVENVLDSRDAEIAYKLEIDKNDEYIIGTRTAMINDDYIIVYNPVTKRIEEINIASGDVSRYYVPKYPVAALTNSDSYIIVYEVADGKTYFEAIKWRGADKIVCTPEKNRIEIGEEIKLNVEFDSVLNGGYDCVSSNPEVATFARGTIIGWKVGTAEFTAKEQFSGVETKFTVSVVKPNNFRAGNGVIKSDGLVTNNASGHNYINYLRWTDITRSNLISKPGGGFIRVEALKDSILVEEYDSSYKKTSSNNISLELPLFGGFFNGQDNYYVVFGQKNAEESDENEVIRVVKYSKEWKRLDACSYYGINTSEPFVGGRVSMAEVAGNLFVHTSHEMYADDGVNHQANMTLMIDEETMTSKKAMYEVGGLAYVSHSLNQFILADGEAIYRLDHGDGYPRAIQITRTDLTDIDRRYLAYESGAKHVSGIYGAKGDNDTGISVGDFELTPEGYMVAYNYLSYYAPGYSPDNVRNIILAWGDKQFSHGYTKALTEYDNVNDNVIVGNPYIVRLGDYHFLAMWEENWADNIYTRMVLTDAWGNLQSDIIATKYRLSDCKPVLTDDGLVVWYVTDGENIDFYEVNPYKLDALNVPLIICKTIVYSTVTVNGTPYDGTPKLPNVKVVVDDVELIKDQDYRIIVDDNIDVGSYKFEIEGIGTYFGKITNYYYISKGVHKLEFNPNIIMEADQISTDIGAVSSGEIKYSVSDERVVTCDSTGHITRVGEGSTTIYLYVEGDKNYIGTNGTIFVTVKKKEEPKEEIKNPFKDIPDGKWYTEAVLYVYQRGAMTGLNETTFGPTDNLSRAMTVQLLWKLEGSVDQELTHNPFPDVAVSHWSANAVYWAKINGIAGGYTAGEKAGLFGKSDNITRQEFVKILYGYANFKGFNTSVSSVNSYKKVEDGGSISSWAREAMNWGYENELIANGSLFKPKDNITRREAATIIARFLKQYMP